MNIRNQLAFGGGVVDYNALISTLINDTKTITWLNPTVTGGAVRDVDGKEKIWWDMMIGSALRGSELSSGSIVLNTVYEITACAANFFYTGCAVGDVFPCAVVKTLSGTNKVKQVLGNHLTNPTLANQPTNGVFNGRTQYLRTFNFTCAQPCCIYVVLNQLAWTNNRYVISGGGGSNAFVVQNGTTPRILSNAGTYINPITNPNLSLIQIGTKYILKILFNGASSKFQVNNLSFELANAGVNGLTGLTIGSYYNGADCSTIEISELILRNSVDTIQFENTLTDLLDKKWSLNAGLPAGNTVNMTITQPESRIPVSFSYQGTTGANLYISWGDGVVDKLVCNGTYITLTRTHSISGILNFRIGGELSKLEKFECNSELLSVDISEFSKCANIWYLGFRFRVKELYGSIDGLTKLKEIWAYAPLTVGAGLSGTLDNLPLLEVFECQGVEGNYFVANIGGRFESIPNLKQWCAVTNTTGNIGGCINLEYLSYGYVSGGVTGTIEQGESTVRMWGNMDNMVALWFIALNGGCGTLTGDPTKLVSMENFQYVPELMTKPSSLSLMTKLSYFYAPSTWQLTVTEVNQYLADIWANREVVRTHLKNTVGATYSVGYRSIDLSRNALNAAPTGQGITDKNNLNATISPAVPGNGVAWTITTN